VQAAVRTRVGELTVLCSNQPATAWFSGCLTREGLVEISRD
jgi:hypothetical protein